MAENHSKPIHWLIWLLAAVVLLSGFWYLIGLDRYNSDVVSRLPLGDSVFHIFRIVSWFLLWLPGVALQAALFLRQRKSVFVLAPLLQIAAIVLYLAAPQVAPIAGTIGFIGLLLPLFLQPLKTRTGTFFIRLLLIGLGILFYLRNSYEQFPMSWIWMSAFWIIYAPQSLWHGLSRAMESARPEDLKKEETLKEIRAYRWLKTAGYVLGVLFGASFVILSILIKIVLSQNTR